VLDEFSKFFPTILFIKSPEYTLLFFDKKVALYLNKFKLISQGVFLSGSLYFLITESTKDHSVTFVSAKVTKTSQLTQKS